MYLPFLLKLQRTPSYQNIPYDTTSNDLIFNVKFTDISQNDILTKLCYDHSGYRYDTKLLLKTHVNIQISGLLNTMNYTSVDGDTEACSYK